MSENDYPGSFAFPIPQNIAATLMQVGKGATLAESIAAINANQQSGAARLLADLYRIGDGTIRRTSADVRFSDAALQHALDHHDVVDGEDVLIYRDDEYIPDFADDQREIETGYVIWVSAYPAYFIGPDGKHRAIHTPVIILPASAPSVSSSFADLATSEVRFELMRVHTQVTSHLVPVDTEWLAGVVVAEFHRLIAAGEAQRQVPPKSAEEAFNDWLDEKE